MRNKNKVYHPIVEPEDHDVFRSSHSAAPFISGLLVATVFWVVVIILAR